MLPGAQLFQFTPLCERLQSTGYDISPKTDFNSRLSARGYQFSCHQFNIRLFQFTPLCERLLDITHDICIRFNFNSRLSARGYRSDFEGWRWATNFNSRLSARGYLTGQYSKTISHLFQFTPLCERLQYLHMAEYRSHFYFNSRLSARGYCVAAQYDFCIIISIHASLREATTDNLILISETVFQFTPLCERLPLFHTKVPRCTLFQFTPLCERLLFPAFLSLLLFYFNSRLSARGYVLPVMKLLFWWIFQFTPLCERLPGSAQRSSVQHLFQFTPLCERLQQKQTIYSCISA